jgi:predicted nucleic acid-binding protein
MLVVADATPVNILIRVRHIDVLGHLFRRVLLPPEVLAELSHTNTPAEVKSYVASLPEWMTVQPASHPRQLPPLDVGETAAICLAQEVRADAILLDEKAGRRIAVREGLNVIGTLGILERAAEIGLLQLAEAIERLGGTDYHIDPGFIAQALERDAQRRASNE